MDKNAVFALRLNVDWETFCIIREKIFQAFIALKQRRFPDLRNRTRVSRLRDHVLSLK